MLPDHHRPHQGAEARGHLCGQVQEPAPGGTSQQVPLIFNDLALIPCPGMSISTASLVSLLNELIEKLKKKEIVVTGSFLQ